MTASHKESSNTYPQHVQDILNAIITPKGKEYAYLGELPANIDRVAFKSYAEVALQGVESIAPPPDKVAPAPQAVQILDWIDKKSLDYSTYKKSAKSSFDRLSVAVLLRETNYGKTPVTSSAIGVALGWAENGNTESRVKFGKKDVIALLYDSYKYGGKTNEEKKQYLLSFKSNKYCAMGVAQFRPFNAIQYLPEGHSIAELNNLNNPTIVFETMKTFLVKNAHMQESYISAVEQIPADAMKKIITAWQSAHENPKYAGISFTNHGTPPSSGIAPTMFFDEMVAKGTIVLDDNLKPHVKTLTPLVNSLMYYNNNPDYALELAGLLSIGGE